MKKSSEHHILPPNSQEENDKAAIRNIMETYDIDEAIDVLYNTFKEIRTHSNNIDKCITDQETEFKENKKIDADD